MKFIAILIGCILYLLRLISSRLNTAEGYFEKIYFDFSIKHLNSNHPRRLHYHANACNLIGYFLPRGLRIKDQVELKVMRNFRFSQDYLSDLDRRHLIYIGDSHVEFFSRIRQCKGDSFFNNSHAIWLGPSTLLGLKCNDVKVRVLDGLSKVQINSDCKEIYIVWSLGTIDARVAVYEMAIRGAIQDNSDLQRTVFDSLNHLNQVVGVSLQQTLSRRFPSLRLKNCFMACSNCFLEGDAPRTVREIKKLRQEQEFPIFGSVEDRKTNVDAINTAIKSWCHSNNYIFFDPHEDATKIINKQYYEDSVHLTDARKINSATRGIFFSEENR